MCEREKELFLLDIIIAIEKIRDIAKDYEYGDDIQYNYRDWDAIIREFEIVGEAMRYCIQFGLFNDERDKRKVIDFRNILTHKYFGIDPEAVLNIAKENLDWLENLIVNRFMSVDQRKREEVLNYMLDENRYLPFVFNKLNQLKNESE
ncbi:HepT-like ribonuclease domain-containing protein [Nautilia sp.]